MLTNYILAGVSSAWLVNPASPDQQKVFPNAVDSVAISLFDCIVECKKKKCLGLYPLAYSWMLSMLVLGGELGLP